MKKYFVRDDGAVSYLHETGAHIPGYRAVYLAFEADARIAELEQANKLLRDELNVDESVMTTDQAHIAELESALRIYGGHGEGCEISWKGDCSCGWPDLKAALGKQSG